MVKRRILLVDQEPRITVLVRQALEETGQYSVKSEHPGALALAAARLFRPDLIVVDLVADGAEGDVITRQFAADAILRDTPVVCLRSLRSSEAVGSSGTVGGYDFFITPVGIEELVRGVEELFFARAGSGD
jgi:DNA-binding response OmpR family regulator